MDVVEGLRQLGMGEYEARAYAALVAHPGSTGYEVAKHSGVPRAKIYETLATLASRDIIASSREGDRVLYHPLDPEALLRRHVEGAELLARELDPTLRQLAGDESPPPLLTVRSHQHMLARARDVLASAGRRAFVSGWPAEIEALSSDLERAEGRGVMVYALVYGDAEVAVRHLVRHHPLDPDHLGASPAGPLPWLIVVADHSEVLLAQAAPADRAVALWTRNPTLAMVAAEYVKHDIYLVELDRLLEARGVSLEREMAHLQRMWFDDVGGEESR